MQSLEARVCFTASRDRDLHRRSTTTTINNTEITTRRSTTTITTRRSTTTITTRRSTTTTINTDDQQQQTSTNNNNDQQQTTPTTHQQTSAPTSTNTHQKKNATPTSAVPVWQCNQSYQCWSRHSTRFYYDAVTTTSDFCSLWRPPRDVSDPDRD